VIDRAGIKLERVLAASLPAVYADAGQLEQVVMNLFVNALDAMPGGGTLTLETTKTKREDDGELVLIRVRDTGVGIAPELQKKIFEPFFSTKERGKGTGLGLPICQQILRNFRGSLSLESEVGKGSVFTVSLPAIVRPATPPGGTSSSETGSGETVSTSSSELVAASDSSVTTDSQGELASVRTASDHHEEVP
jgi:two-component system cell cycle sensor histidine kinase/response regulator CckA